MGIYTPMFAYWPLCCPSIEAVEVMADSVFAEAPSLNVAGVKPVEVQRVCVIGVPSTAEMSIIFELLKSPLPTAFAVEESSHSLSGLGGSCGSVLRGPTAEAADENLR